MFPPFCCAFGTCTLRLPDDTIAVLNEEKEVEVQLLFCVVFVAALVGENEEAELILLFRRLVATDFMVVLLVLLVLCFALKVLLGPNAPWCNLMS